MLCSTVFGPQVLHRKGKPEVLQNGVHTCLPASTPQGCCEQALSLRMSEARPLALSRQCTCRLTPHTLRPSPTLSVPAP